MSVRKILSIAGPSALVNVYRDSEYNEYRVRIAGGEAPQDTYFTTDREDAEETAAVLAGIVKWSGGKQ